MIVIFRKFLLFIMAIVLFSFVSACGSRKGAQAIKTYNIGEYNRAEGLLKSAYSAEKNKFYKAEYSYFLAESYRLVNQPKKAIMAYVRAIRYKYPEPLAHLYLAECYRKTGEFEKAKESYAAFLELRSFDKRAINGLASCDLAMGVPVENGMVVESFKPLNSKYSDFAAVYADPLGDQILFTSMRTETKKRRMNRITGQGNSSLFVSKLDAKGAWSKPERLTDPFPPMFDSGTPNLTSDLRTLFFTHCPYDKVKPSSATIYEVGKSGGRWGDLKEVVPGGDSLMVAHPAISPDGSVLYFVSDREGGYGGKDLYRSMRSTEGWSKAENLGSLINTPGDEMFPYVRSDGTLYFASDGQIGYGGLDLFRVLTNSDGQFMGVENLGKPINSSSDDFSIVFQGKRNEGIFSSSRASAKGYDDLYTFVVPEVRFDLLGKLSGSARQLPENVEIRIIGTDGTNMKLPLRGDGGFGTLLQGNTDYLLTASAVGYFHAKANVTTKGLLESRTLEVNLEMNRSSEVLRMAPVFMVADSVVADSKPVLEQALTYLKNNPSFALELKSHVSWSSDVTEAQEAAMQQGLKLKEWLVQRGIDGDRITVESAGSEEPLVVTAKLIAKNALLREGDVLNSSTLRRFRLSDRKLLELLNDRVEFILVDGSAGAR